MNESHFNRGTWLALGASVLLLLTVLGVNLYRYTLPTDGWDYGDFENGATRNVLRLPSDLQVGDVPMTIGGVPFTEFTNQPLGQAGELPPNWRPGQMVQYTIQRGDQTLTIPVPIGNWNLPVLLNAILADGSNLLSAIYLVIGAWVLYLRPGNLGAQVLFFLGSVRLAMELILWIPLSIGDTGNAFAVTAVSLLGFYIYGILLFPTFLLLSLVFPKPKRPFRTYPALTLLLLYLFEPLLLIAFGSISAEVGPTIGFALVAVLGLLTVISVLHTIITERGDAVARAQILWVGLGVALVAGFQMIENVAGFLAGPDAPTVELNRWLSLLGAVIYLAVPVTVAIAILRYRLWDIDILIRRTATYTLVVALLAIVYFSSVILLQQIFSALTGLGQNEIVTVLSTLTIAALFVPLRNRIQNVIDRRFNRKKYDAQRVLQDFANTVRDETDLEKLTGRLMQVVDETMQPKSVSMWLKRTTGDGRFAKERLGTAESSSHLRSVVGGHDSL